MTMNIEGIVYIGHSDSIWYVGYEDKKLLKNSFRAEFWPIL